MNNWKNTKNNSFKQEQRPTITEIKVNLPTAPDCDNDFSLVIDDYEKSKTKPTKNTTTTIIKTQQRNRNQKSESLKIPQTIDDRNAQAHPTTQT